jgi:hypothetical protein
MKKLQLFLALSVLFAWLASGCQPVRYSTFVTFAPDTPQSVPPATLLQAQRVLQKRLQAGLTGKSNVQVDQNTLRVGLANPNDLSAAIGLATGSGLLNFFHSDTYMQEGQAIPASATSILTGADIARAKASREPTTGQWMIEVTMNSAGKTKLAEYTGSHVGAFLVIAQDNRVISSPKVNAAITGGSAVIQGNFDQAAADLLAIMLNSGALPVPLKVVK